jgi:hypothetical protein
MPEKVVIEAITKGSTEIARRVDAFRDVMGDQNEKWGRSVYVGESSL